MHTFPAVPFVSDIKVPQRGKSANRDYKMSAAWGARCSKWNIAAWQGELSWLAAHTHTHHNTGSVEIKIIPKGLLSDGPDYALSLCPPSSSLSPETL